MPDVDVPLDISQLSSQLAGLVVAALEQLTPDSLRCALPVGRTLVVRPLDGGFATILQRPKRGGGGRGPGSGPTRRRKEYLEFIKRYMHRFGVSPPETDIQRYFLVSAPAVNQMIQTLERRGFTRTDAQRSP